VGNKVIQPYNCGIQYQRVLKTERYDDKRVVPKSSLTIVYQDMSHEVILKYWGRDISESSIVSSRSKDGLAGRRTTTFIHPQTTDFAFLKYANTKRQRKSVRQL